MLNDPLANVLSKVLNSERIGRSSAILHPASDMVRKVLALLQAKGYVGSMEDVASARGGVISLNLLGAINECGVIKPRFPVRKDGFEKFEKRYLPAKGVGIIVVSTPQGVMTHDDAKSKGLGGRLVAYCY